MKDNDGSSNFELMEKAKKLRLNNFRGVFMRDQLNFRSLRNECGILNLNTNNLVAIGSVGLNTETKSTISTHSVLLHRRK